MAISKSTKTTDAESVKIVWFERLNYRVDSKEDDFIAFLKSLAKLRSKLKTSYFVSDFDNIDKHFEAYLAALQNEDTYLTNEKNEFLDQLQPLLVIILSKGRGNTDEDDKDTCKVANKVVKICGPFEKGEKRLDRGKLDERYSRGLKVKAKLEALGDDKLSLIGAVKQVSKFGAAVDGYADTKDERDSYLSKIKGLTTAAKAEVVADVIGIFECIDSVQRKSEGAENEFVRQLNKLISNTKTRAAKSDASNK